MTKHIRNKRKTKQIREFSRGALQLCGNQQRRTQSRAASSLAVGTKESFLEVGVSENRGGQELGRREPVEEECSKQGVFSIFCPKGIT